MPVKEQVNATVPANKEKGTKEKSATINVNYAATIAEAVQMFGEVAMLSNAFANWKVTLQSNIRNGLKRGETQEQIQVRLQDAKMGIVTKGALVDPVQAYVAKFQSATPEDQKKMLAELQRRAAK